MTQKLFLQRKKKNRQTKGTFWTGFDDGCQRRVSDFADKNFSVGMFNSPRSTKTCCCDSFGGNLWLFWIDKTLRILDHDAVEKTDEGTFKAKLNIFDLFGWHFKVNFDGEWWFYVLLCQLLFFRNCTDNGTNVREVNLKTCESVLLSLVCKGERGKKPCTSAVFFKRDLFTCTSRSFLAVSESN